MEKKVYVNIEVLSHYEKVLEIFDKMNKVRNSRKDLKVSKE